MYIATNVYMNEFALMESCPYIYQYIYIYIYALCMIILMKCITLHTNYIIDNNSITIKAISFDCVAIKEEGKPPSNVRTV